LQPFITSPTSGESPR